MKKIKIQNIFFAIMAIVMITFATSCEKNRENAKIEQRQKSVINDQKYIKIGIEHNKCLDIIKNDKDFFNILNNNILDTIFNRNFGEIKYIDTNLVIKSYIGDILNYAEYMLENEKITRREYKFCLFIDSSANCLEQCENIGIAKEKVKLCVKEYIKNIYKEDSITQDEVDYILVGSYVFLYSLDYWYNEFQDENSNWLKLLQKNSSKYFDRDYDFASVAEADAIASSECLSKASEACGCSYSPDNYDYWNTVYSDCKNISAKISTFAAIKQHLEDLHLL